MRRRSVVLALEQLETREVPTISFHNGLVIPHVEVQPVYYGQEWNTSAWLQRASDLNGFLGFIANSSYMDMLSEYGVARGGLLNGGIIDNGISAGQTVDDTAIQKMLDKD